MQIEWIAACREVVWTGTRCDVLEIHQAGVQAPTLPLNIMVTVAVCIRASDEEIADGGVATFHAEVLDESGSPVGWRNEVFASEMGDQAPDGFERRHIYDLPIEFTAADEDLALYRIDVWLENQPRVGVGFLVVRAPASDD